MCECGQVYDGPDTMCFPCTQIAFCVEGDRFPAVGERFVGFAGETERVEMVCYDHAWLGV